MTARPRNITFDCADPYRLAGFWSQVTGYGEDPDDDNAPSDSEAFLVGPDGQPNLLFIRVPEGKASKNPPPPGPHAGTADPRPGGGPAAGAGRHDGGRPPPA
jgi:hypothetical protein